MEQMFVFDPRKGCAVLAGTLDGKTFIKRAKSNHFVRRYKGYGISVEIIMALKKKKIQNIKIVTKDNSYLSKVKDWERIEDDLGHGAQNFMPVSWMEELGKDVKKTKKKTKK